jgi:hypothetical protein
MSLRTIKILQVISFKLMHFYVDIDLFLSHFLHSLKCDDILNSVLFTHTENDRHPSQYN